MASVGILIGIALLLGVILCGWLLGRKANQSVQRFRAEHHESFRGRKAP